MKFRAPAVPLATVDPYFSLWSAADRLTDCPVSHWTGKPNTLSGTLVIDGTAYRFMGAGAAPAMEQTNLEISALSTTYTFEAASVRLTAAFLTPLLPEDPALLSRPVSYLELSAESLDGQSHTLSAQVEASEELCLDCRGQGPVSTAPVFIPEIAAMRMGSAAQPVLGRCGDDLRIDWGYFYLCVRGGSVGVSQIDGMTSLRAEADLSRGPVLFGLAYDDVESLIYFGRRLKSVWNQNGRTIEEAILDAFREYPALRARCARFSRRLWEDAAAAGGEQYAQLLSLAYRQAFAAHKLAVGPEGELLFVSKECFSNGCAATADVSYPSVPLFLLYNPELVKGMLRPIFKYAESGVWPYDFAPHDAGTYPLLNGQIYGNGTELAYQMPVEECGNMLIMSAAAALAEGDASFLAPHMDTLRKWAEYLRIHGVDPENQLCTDDFAGHLAHNCNLSLKAVMALAAMSQICALSGLDGSGYLADARRMAAKWPEMAANGDGSFRLAFDQPDTFSMKYNLIWDKVFGSGIFPAALSAGEFAANQTHLNRYGMPLDNRADYTKSDWLVWTGCFAETREQFESFIGPLWLAYHESPSRVPLTDWYETSTAKQVGFQNRTVQGGLFMKLLCDSGKCRW
ncbi:MAG: DUF4965 domain-containing protein [Oscillospiraceae bacterium]|jgi:hypothetical protein|nr:DUF4965 domain-containing protein [Oscillospiraceae bacterium]